MADERMIAQYEALHENPEFVAQMKAADSKEDIQKVFANFGFDFSKEEIDAFVAMVSQMDSEDELTVGDLDNVAGGAGVEAITILKWAWTGTKAIAKTCWNAGKAVANWGL